MCQFKKGFLQKYNFEIFLENTQKAQRYKIHLKRLFRCEHFPGRYYIFDKWPEKVLRKMLDWFEKIPRFGWSRTHSYYEKFNVNVSLNDFKKKALKVLTIQLGSKC